MGGRKGVSDINQFVTKSSFENGEILKKCQDAWLDINVKDTELMNPLMDIPVYCAERPELYVLWLMQQPEYFSFICNTILGIDILPQQAVILECLWKHKFPMLIASRGCGKTFLMAVYSLLRMLLIPGRKIVLCGSVFRQSKFIFNYMEKISKNSVLASILSRDSIKRDPDKWQFFIGDSVCSALPIGDGQNIRGERANDIITDEFATHNPDVFETVIAGFGSVSSDPVGNVKLRAAQEMAANLGIELETDSLGMSKSIDNQIIITGTAYYEFNHFATYWKRWHDFICCKSNTSQLNMSNDERYKDINPNDYAIIRIPYELIPKGVMDESMVARSKATVTTGIYEMEFGACFSKDSQGFFKRSLIEKCVTSPKRLFTFENESFTHFSASIRGNKASRYVMGIDPASERARFAVVVLELRPDHRRVVYCWTTKRSEHIEQTKTNDINLNFYNFCARKIRDIMRTFPIEHIALDAGGGGITIMEALHDKSIVLDDEQLIWPIVDYDKKPTTTDAYSGLHILELINFSDTKWISEANHGLKYDLEHQMLLFPHIDPVELAGSITDEADTRVRDTLEDCILEIEDIKNELSTIIIMSTPTGKERWDTPDVKISAGNSVQRGKMDKDRYSALLLANMAARKIQALTPDTRPMVGGGVAELQPKGKNIDFGFSSAPPWYKKDMDRFNYLG